jgi:hypothetical protein
MSLEYYSPQIPYFLQQTESIETEMNFLTYSLKEKLSMD